MGGWETDYKNRRPSLLPTRRVNDDCTLFAWGLGLPAIPMSTNFRGQAGFWLYYDSPVDAPARSPADFRSPTGLLRPYKRAEKFRRPTFSPNQQGMSISLPLKQDPVFHHTGYGIHGIEPLSGHGIIVPLTRRSYFQREHGDDDFCHSSWLGPVKVPRSSMDGAKWASITICSPWVAAKWSSPERELTESPLPIPTIRIALSIYHGLCGCHNADDFAVKKIYSDAFPFPVMFRPLQAGLPRPIWDALGGALSHLDNVSVG